MMNTFSTRHSKNVERKRFMRLMKLMKFFLQQKVNFDLVSNAFCNIHSPFQYIKELSFK